MTRWNNLRFLANVEFFLQELDEAKLDSYVGVSAVLHGGPQGWVSGTSVHVKKTNSHLDSLLYCAESSNSKVLTGFWSVWDDVQRFELYDVGFSSWSVRLAWVPCRRGR
jgi:hypothetical protein